MLEDDDGNDFQHLFISILPPFHKDRVSTMDD